jgi:hypothetical protein
MWANSNGEIFSIYEIYISSAIQKFYLKVKCELYTNIAEVCASLCS